jgi:hypothetical protein
MKLSREIDRTIGKKRCQELYERTKHLLTGTYGEWDPITRTWKILKYGITGYIASYLYKKDGKKYIHKIPNQPKLLVCKTCGKPIFCSEENHIREPIDLVERSFIIGDIGEYDLYAYYVSQQNEYKLIYLSSCKTQMLNCDLLYRDKKLVIAERSESEACHAFLNITITQEDIDSYNPDRLDAYLYEIFDEDNYQLFLDAVIHAYTVLYRRRCYFIHANNMVKKILTSMMKTLFGSLYFDNPSDRKYGYPQLTIRPFNKYSGYSKYYSCIRFPYFHGGTTFYIGSEPIIESIWKDIIHTKDIDSIDSIDSTESIPRSALVKLALDIASCPCDEPSFITYYR